MKKLLLLAFLAIGTVAKAQSEYAITVESKKPSGIIDFVLNGTTSQQHGDEISLTTLSLASDVAQILSGETGLSIQTEQKLFVGEMTIGRHTIRVELNELGRNRGGLTGMGIFFNSSAGRFRFPMASIAFACKRASFDFKASSKTSRKDMLLNKEKKETIFALRRKSLSFLYCLISSGIVSFSFILQTKPNIVIEIHSSGSETSLHIAKAASFPPIL